MSAALRLARDRRGVSALEFGVVAPAVLLLLLGLVDLGRLLGDQHALDHAVDAAARYAIVNSASATVASITAKFQNAAAPLLGGCGGCSVNVSFAPGFSPGGTVTVAATYAWTPAVGLVFSAQTLRSATTLTVQH